MFVRPAEVIIARELYGDEAAEIYHTHLFAHYGDLYTSEQLSTILGKFTFEWLKVTLRLADYRQFSVGVSKKRVGAAINLAHAEETINHLQGSHRAGTVARIYGLAKEDLAYFDDGMRTKFDLASSLWHKHVLRFSNVKLPLPTYDNTVAGPAQAAQAAPAAAQGLGDGLDIEALATHIAGIVAPQIIDQVSAAITKKVVSAVVTALGRQQVEEEMQDHNLPDPPRPRPSSPRPSSPPPPRNPAPPPHPQIPEQDMYGPELNDSYVRSLFILIWILSHLIELVNFAG